MKLRVINKHGVELFIPDLASTEQAMAWGLRLNDEERALLLQTYRAAERSARHQLKRGRLQAAADLATQAQLWHEAAEAKPALIPEDVTP